MIPNATPSSQPTCLFERASGRLGELDCERDAPIAAGFPGSRSLQEKAANMSEKGGKYSIKRRDWNNIHPNITLARKDVAVATLMRRRFNPRARAPPMKATRASCELSSRVLV